MVLVLVLVLLLPHSAAIIITVITIASIIISTEIVIHSSRCCLRCRYATHGIIKVVWVLLGIHHGYAPPHRVVPWISRVPR